jgi:hypothetical protein
MAASCAGIERWRCHTPRDALAQGRATFAAMRFHVSRKAERVLTHTAFRLLVAFILVLGHVASVIDFAHERFDGAHFDAAPRSPPAFRDVAHDPFPQNSKRLLVSRWDAEHYLGIAMRGFSQCPHRKLVPDDVRGPVCDVAFYPGYPVLGAIVGRATHLPMDFALWFVSLGAASFAFFLWTDPAIVGAIGLGGAYASLLAFNFFPPACYLVFIMTEACTAAGVLAAFVALARRRYALGALAAAFVGTIRITGVCAEVAFVMALVSWIWLEPPRGAWRWLGRFALIGVAASGTMGISGYYWLRFGDPLQYVHAHSASFHHEGGFKLLLHPKPEWIIHAMDATEHQLVWAGALAFFFLAGHREALRRFPVPAQVYAYSVVPLIYLISMAGTIDLYFMAGLSRYVLAAAPAFLAVGALLKRRPVALAAWLFVCAWHSREVDTCYYLGDVGPYGLRKCNMTQWLDY